MEHKGSQKFYPFAMDKSLPLLTTNATTATRGMVTLTNGDTQSQSELNFLQQANYKGNEISKLPESSFSSYPNALDDVRRRCKPNNNRSLSAAGAICDRKEATNSCSVVRWRLFRLPYFAILLVGTLILGIPVAQSARFPSSIPNVVHSTGDGIHHSKHCSHVYPKPHEVRHWPLDLSVIAAFSFFFHLLLDYALKFTSEG